MVGCIREWLINFRMMRTLGILLILLLPVSKPTLGQMIDSILISLKTQPRPDIRYDTRNSFIFNRSAPIHGVKVGVNFERRIRFGLGFNWLSDGYILDDIEQISITRLKFWYLSPYIEYTFYRNARWEFSIPVLIGMGGVQKTIIHDLFFRSKTPLRPVLLYEPYMVGIYKPVKYLGIGLGIGYRLAIVGNAEFGYKITSPIYALRFAIYTAEILKTYKQISKRGF